MQRSFAAPAHVRAASPLLILVLLVVGGIAFTCIAAAGVALYLSSTGRTDFLLLGMELSTGNVGVALTAIGVLTLFFTVRKLLKIVYSLAALPSQNSVDRPGVSGPPAKHRSPLRDLELLVRRATEEASDVTWHDLRQSMLFTEPGFSTAAGIHLREYFGGYLDQIIRLVPLIRNSDTERVSELVNCFFTDTALNHVLDAPWASYLISDLIEKVDDLVRARGGVIKRIDLRRPCFFEAWREPAKNLEGITKDDLDQVRFYRLGTT